MIQILEEPVGSTYKQLISLAFKICDEFILVKREQLELTEKTKILIEELKPYVNTVKKQEEWPGTRLLGHHADIYYFNCKPELEELLINKAKGLYRWRHPDLLEDLCFFKNKEVWLLTTAHEQLGFITTTDRVEISMIREIEGIMIQEIAVSYHEV
ncbi:MULTISPECIES: hypothetical protein [Paenibacillus]|uniref:Stage III sporulation protein AH n=1 Tax=Paenibacillus lactis TaxID=228574 RepID=A0ABS4FAV2_9BACL|nr:hypothetical protein [Paenibacillus lactis]MBP1893376.1 hypothetical protein [Paenibacillus lactis]HAG01372.1 hypothetical protein [Paenibacillus lactis]